MNIVIIVGNSGVGKSYVGNVVVGSKQFEHKVNASGVTIEMETSTTGDNAFTIVTVPGLIEADQMNMDRNKNQIERAFQTFPTSRIVFVFTGAIGGRISNQDIMAYKALDAAYKFNPSSVVYLFNKMSDEIIANAETKLTYINALKSHLSLPSSVSNDQFVFVANLPTEQLENFSSDVHKKYASDIRRGLTATTAATHFKQSEVILAEDRLKQLQNQLEDERRKQQEELQKQQEAKQQQEEQNRQLQQQIQQAQHKDTSTHLNFHGFKLLGKRIW